MLLFKKRFLEAIRRGEKTQTIRLWRRRMMRTGQRSYIPGVGYIQVELVEAVALDDLTDDDARPDGFATADALKAELRTLYAGQLADGQQAYRVRFHVTRPVAPGGRSIPPPQRAPGPRPDPPAAAPSDAPG